MSGIIRAISRGSAVILGLGLGLAALPQTMLAAGAEVTTTEEFTFSFPSTCAGETLDATVTRHSVQRNNSDRPADEHVNWSGGEAVGRTTGTVYWVSSIVNYQTGPDTFMHHLTFRAPGITYEATFLDGAFFFGPYELVEEHCNR